MIRTTKGVEFYQQVKIVRFKQPYNKNHHRGSLLMVWTHPISSDI